MPRECSGSSDAGKSVASRFGRSHIIVIGVNTYDADRGIPTLRTAVADAVQVARLLTTQHGFGPEPPPLIDATTEEVRALLRDLPSKVKASDRLILYFAGHGLWRHDGDGPAGYLLLRDAKIFDPKTFLPMRELQEALAAISCHHVLVILDCCFAGAFRWTSMRDIHSPDLVSRQRFDLFVDSAAWQVLTSAASAQKAADELGDRGEGSSGHSPFAEALLEGLGGAADLNGDGLITATELYLFVRDRVQEASERRDHRQTPGIFPLRKHDHGEFVFQVPGRSLELPPAEALTLDKNPYRALESYDEEHRTLFFGRSRVVFGLIRSILHRPLTVVTGPSGTGKSSVVKAGLIPAVRRREAAAPRGRGRWRIVGPYRPAEAIDARLHEQRFPGGEPHQDLTLVVIDQLEEVLSQRGDHETAAPRLLETLARWVSDMPNQLRLVVTVRSDFEPLLENSPLAPWWRSSRFVVPPMTQEELRSAIERPADVRDLHFHPRRLVDEIVNEVVQMPGALPLLSFMLSELYRQYCARDGDDRALLQFDYEALGGVAGAVTERASAELEALSAGDRHYERTIRNVMLRMVEQVGGELARRRAMLSELSYEDPDENSRVSQVLLRYSEARLLVSGAIESSPSSPIQLRYVEPAHDVLIRWDRVQKWLLEGQERSPLLRAVATAAQTWSEHGRDKDYLWHGDPRLAQLRQWVKEPDHPLNAIEVGFVRRSQRRRSVRLGTIGLVVTGIIAVLATISVVALQQSQRAQRGEASARTAQGRAEEETLRAKSALQSSRGRQASILALVPGKGLTARAVALQAALPELRTGRPLRPEIYTGAFDADRALVSIVLAGHTDTVSYATFSPRGDRILTMSRDRTARVWDPVTGRELAVLRGHTDDLSSARFSPDGAQVMTTSEDRTARIWDATTGKQITALIGHTRGVKSAAYSPDGTRVVTASSDRSARIWDVATGHEVLAFVRHSDIVLSAAFSPDGKRVVSAGGDGTARIWSADTGRELLSLVNERLPVFSAAFSPDGRQVITRAWDESPRVWDTTTGREIALLNGHTNDVLSVAYSPEGKWLVTASIDHSARVWNAKTGRTILTLKGHTGLVSSAAFTSDGKRVVTASYDGTARIWDASTGREIATLRGHTGEVLSAELSPDASRVLTTSGDTTARVWEANAVHERSIVLAGHAQEIHSVAFSPDGERIVTASRDGTARVWSAVTGREVLTLKGHVESVNSAVFSSDGRRIVTASWDKTGTLWSAATGARIATLRGHSSNVNSAVFSPDGKRVVTASSDDTARVWEVATAREVAVLRPQVGGVTAALFSPDGKRIVTVGWKGIARIWEVATAREIRTLEGHRGAVTSIAFSADGVRIATAGSDKIICVWDAATGRELARLQGHTKEVRHVAFSPDGTQVATASDDDTARVWDAATGRELATLRGHTARVVAVAFSPDGARLFTASLDDTVRLWDISTGQALAVLGGHTGAIDALAVSPDGAHIATASADSTARIWGPIEDRQLVRGLCADLVAVAYIPDITRDEHAEIVRECNR